MAISTWEQYLELEALMMPGEPLDVDPLERAERDGPPVDELAETRRPWTAGNSAAGACVDCGRYQPRRYVARCSRCCKRMSKAPDVATAPDQEAEGGAVGWWG